MQVPDTPYSFDAFVSYKRSDGARYAQRLRSRLQHYKLPAKLRTAHPHRLRVYLDTVYERAGEDFFKNTIEPALASSAHLIVLQTNDSVPKPGDLPLTMMEKEIEYFRGLPQGSNISVALASGSLNDPLPGNLGGSCPNIEIVDVRSLGRWFGAPALRAFVATLYALSPDDMPLLHREERRRTTRIAAFAITLAALFLILVTSVFWIRTSSNAEQTRLQQTQRLETARQFLLAGNIPQAVELLASDDFSDEAERQTLRYLVPYLEPLEETLDNRAPDVFNWRGTAYAVTSPASLFTVLDEPVLDGGVLPSGDSVALVTTDLRVLVKSLVSGRILMEGTLSQEPQAIYHSDGLLLVDGYTQSSYAGGVERRLSVVDYRNDLIGHLSLLESHEWRLDPTCEHLFVFERASAGALGTLSASYSMVISADGLAAANIRPGPTDYLQSPPCPTACCQVLSTDERQIALSFPSVRPEASFWKRTHYKPVSKSYPELDPALAELDWDNASWDTRPADWPSPDPHIFDYALFAHVEPVGQSTLLTIGSAAGAQYGQYTFCWVTGNSVESCREVIFHGEAGRTYKDGNGKLLLIADFPFMGHPPFILLDLLAREDVTPSELPPSTASAALFGEDGNRLYVASGPFLWTYDSSVRPLRLLRKWTVSVDSSDDWNDLPDDGPIAALLDAGSTLIVVERTGRISGLHPERGSVQWVNPDSALDRVAGALCDGTCSSFVVFSDDAIRLFSGTTGIPLSLQYEFQDEDSDYPFVTFDEGEVLELQVGALRHRRPTRPRALHGPTPAELPTLTGYSPDPSAALLPGAVAR